MLIYGLPFSVSVARELINLKLLSFTGKHEFSWAVMPHRGHFLQSTVPIAAYLFNSPLHRMSSTTAPIRSDADIAGSALRS